VTRQEALAWAKERAAQEHWTAAFSSVVQDMSSQGYPLSADVQTLGMLEAMRGGAPAVREFIDGIR
jgi:hypothetical protein